QPTTALGYGESSVLFSSFPANFSGVDVDCTAVLIRYTAFGDANLDGTVDTTDFNNLASNFSGSGKVWTQGDFNYDGTVDTTDFNLLASNFSFTVSGPGALASSLVPEPASLSVLLVGSTFLSGRNRPPRRARAQRRPGPALRSGPA